MSKITEPSLTSTVAASLLGRSKDGNPSSMRGLVQFIADLRNARARDLEEKRINKELANIREKFREGNLSGYHRKKYVCKLLYIYILGWNVDFGHLEAVNLVSAKKYSEKQIGYLAVTLFFHEQHELLHLVVNSIRKDLTDHNELFNCLALHAIANVGGREMGEALSGEVHRLLISPTSNPFVKKKAALTLLRLYRKNPDIVQQEWAERLISIMDDADIGVTMSVTSLIMALAQDRSEEYKGSYAKACQRLKKIIVDGDIKEEYMYYKVACPWLQVKFLRLLQYFPPSEDAHLRDLLRQSLNQILKDTLIAPKNVQQNNAQHAVLFEAINLVIHLDTEQELMVAIVSKLGKFISSRETNIRYLGLDALTHLAARSDTLDPIKKHQNMILGSLRDRDISVRRKGLDLIYSMVDTENAESIVNELMRYLQTADYAIREEMVLKIAILTEKYATDVQWYVDVSLRLLAMAGDHVSDEVWQRVVQIVTNNEGLQVYAAQNILDYIKLDRCHETIVKIGGYLLGEFGHLIADNQGCSPIEQLIALQAKLPTSSTSTRAILLSCFVKFINLFPEIKPQLIQVFMVYSHAIDAELQQRACEYLALATLQTDDLLRTVCDEMPPYPERTSALLSRLHAKQGAAGDRRTWYIGGKGANSDPKELFIAQQTGRKKSFPNSNGTNGLSSPVNGIHKSPINGIKVDDSVETEDSPVSKTPKTPNFASAAHLSPGWETGYRRLLFQDDGILYQDTQIQVGLRSEYRGAAGIVILYFTNRTSAVMSSLTTTLDTSSPDQFNITTKTLPDSTVQADGQSQQTIMFEAKSVFVEAPTIRISYLAGSLQAITLKLPVMIHKFMEGADLTGDDFFKRWKQIGGPPREAQKIFPLYSKSRTISPEWTQTVSGRYKWSILSGVDANPKNVVGACVLHTKDQGKFGCLMRLEPNYETKMYRLTIRATVDSVSAILLTQMEEHLARGVVHEQH